MGVNGWVDNHGYFSPPMSEEARRSLFDLANKNCFLLSEPWKWTYQDTLSYMDKANIKFQFLSNIPGSYDALKGIQRLRSVHSGSASVKIWPAGCNTHKEPKKCTL